MGCGWVNMTTGGVKAHVQLRVDSDDAQRLM